jgi:hypothetical protein
LTPIGLKVGVLLVKLRTRLLGPLASLIRQSIANAHPRHSNPVDAAYGEIDTLWTISQQLSATNEASRTKPIWWIDEFVMNWLASLRLLCGSPPA